MAGNVGSCSGGPVLQCPTREPNRREVVIELRREVRRCIDFITQFWLLIGCFVLSCRGFSARCFWFCVCDFESVGNATLNLASSDGIGSNIGLPTCCFPHFWGHAMERNRGGSNYGGWDHRRRVSRVSLCNSTVGCLCAPFRNV